MAKITANNIFLGAITSDKLDASVASDLAAADNANTVATIATAIATAAFETANTNAAILANSASPLITTIQIADASYNVLDDTAANTTGGFVVITGSGFTNSSTVVFGSTAAPSVSYVSSTVLRAQTPALTAASYPVYVVNSNGGTAIRVNGLTTSSFPAWSTGASLSNQNANTSFAVNLSATSDSNITYANTSALPAGTTLAANGYFSGTVSIGEQTTYSFDVKATDAENQDASRTFSLTVTVIPQTILYGWGVNSDGRLGTNDTITKSSPTQVGTGTTWNTISTTSDGGRISAAIKTDGTLWAWGRNDYGTLGQNDTISRSSPVQVGILTNWSKVTVGSWNILARKTDGTLWSCGDNGQGQLGLNDRVDRSSPVQIGSNTNWSTISNRSGSNFHFAIKTDGTLWAWGAQGFAGVFGINSQMGYRSSPVQVGASTNWSKIEVAGGMRTAASIKTDGTLWMWGDLRYGFGGLNISGNYRSSPTQVGTGTTWSTISLGREHWLATQTNNTLWACGRNNSRALGNSTIAGGVIVSSPIQIGSDTNWSQVETGFRNSWAIRTDKTLWAWGEDSNGALGFNTNYADKSSPTQIGTSTWQLVRSNGYRTTFAISSV